ncbi:hypothetical protein MMC28_004412 [Mycoblastus sanguinarius]|nr:hypothetical protein [Mycoblastus sanguinarius]
MFGNPDYRNSHFSQKVLTTDEDLRSGSLPSRVAPPITEEWHQFYHDSLGSTSASSASPSSLYFPRDGSSAGVPRSYSTTPISSSSLDLPRNPVLPNLDTSLGYSGGKRKSRYTTFVAENPNVPKPKLDKTLRTCMICFSRNLKCPPGGDPSRCIHCVGKTSYCKGQIDTPKLIDLEWFDETAATFLANHYRTIDHLSHNTPFASLNVTLGLKPGTQDMLHGDIYDLKIPELRDDFRFLLGETRLDDALAAINPTQPSSHVLPKPPIYDLTRFENLCRRICACMLLLRNPNRCSLDWECIGYSRAVHIVLGFLCQLSLQASTSFSQIFDEIRGCSYANRDRQQTPKLMSTLADNLGQIAKEISLFDCTLQQWADSDFPLGHYFFDTRRTLADLEDLGRGLRGTAFDRGYQCSPLELHGIYLTLDSAMSCAITPCHNTESKTQLSFLEVLTHSAGLQSQHGNRFFSLAPGAEMTVIRHGNNFQEPCENIDIGASRPGDEGPQQAIVNGGEFISETDTPLNIDIMQAKPHAILNPGWTVTSNDSSLPRSFEAATVTDPQPEDVSNVMSLDFSNPATWVEQDDFPACQNMFSTCPDEDNHLQPSFHASKTPTHRDSHRDSDETEQSSRATENPAFRNDVQKQERSNKRKRIRSILSRKKQHVTPSHSPQIETSDVLGADSSPKSTMAASDASLLKYSSSRIICTDWIAAWEESGRIEPDIGNAGVVKDVNVANIDRRPLSWPRRHPWRKSLDISVMALTRGLEKLNVERGEGSLPAS